MTEKKKYSVAFGKFDEKLGPICLNATKTKLCLFSGEKCNGFNCKLMVDAINIKGKNFIFDKNQFFYQGGKFSVENPLKRGGIERFVYLISIPDGFSTIKEILVNQLIEKFLKQYTDYDRNPPKDFFNLIRNEWEFTFTNTINSTSYSDIKHFIREKLNLVSLNLQLYMATADIKDDVQQKVLGDSIDYLFEIENFLNQESEEQEIIKIAENDAVCH